VTRSPILIGWTIASRIPAIALASVWRAAKPTTAAVIALEARIVRPTRSSESNSDRAIAMTMVAMTASIARRAKRRRVAVSRERPLSPVTSPASFVARRTRKRSMKKTISAPASSVPSAVKRLLCSWSHV
jgi:hypothetical protein